MANWRSRAARDRGNARHAAQITIKRAADMRYVQEHPVTVDLPLRVFRKQDRAAIKRHFDELHLARYGTSAPPEPAEIVSLRTTVTGVMRKPPQDKIKRGSASPPRAAFTGKRKAYFGKASCRRRPIGAPSCSPATGSTARR